MVEYGGDQVGIKSQVDIAVHMKRVLGSLLRVEDNACHANIDRATKVRVVGSILKRGCLGKQFAELNACRLVDDKADNQRGLYRRQHYDHRMVEKGILHLTPSHQKDYFASVMLCTACCGYKRPKKEARKQEACSNSDVARCGSLSLLPANLVVKCNV